MYQTVLTVLTKYIAPHLTTTQRSALPPEESVPSTSSATRVASSPTRGDGVVSSVLSVQSVQREHAAVYTCQAANTFGSDVRTYFVNVVGES